MAKTVGELRRECDQARSDLTDTLSEIKARAKSAGEDLRQTISAEGVKSQISAKSREWGQTLKSYAENNPLQFLAASAAIAFPAYRFVRTIPVPLALIGAGLALTSRSVRDGISGAMAPTVDQVKSVAGDAVQTASNAFDAASSALAERGATLQEAMKEKATGAVSAIGETIKTPPLSIDRVHRPGDVLGGNAALFGCFGLVLGGVLASALPLAKVEQGAARSLQRRVAAGAGDVIDAAKERVHNAGAAGAHAIADSGLEDTASDKLHSLAQTARTTVTSAVQAALNPRQNDHG